MNTKNTYIFIIWNKALWCKNRILKDLENDFIIKDQVYIQWSKNHFEDNLKALYGRKLGLAKDKIFPCGMGKFLLLVVEDPSPIYDSRSLYDGDGLVNSKIYDKKMLYRTWTAGSHRVHCSDDENETKHDIAVLFGSQFPNRKTNDTLLLDTKGIVGFDDIDDFLQCLSLFGNNHYFFYNDILFIFTKCRYDIECYLNLQKTSNNNYELLINGKIIIIYIFGELDGDLPYGFIDYSSTNNDLMLYISNYPNNYIDFINTRNDSEIISLLSSKNFNVDFNGSNLIREEKHSLIKHLISELKLIIRRIQSIFN